eukprot:m51a1_g9803 hypothetical protein (202) ;mRNA; r:1808742-1809512
MARTTPGLTLLAPPPRTPGQCLLYGSCGAGEDEAESPSDSSSSSGSDAEAEASVEPSPVRVRTKSASTRDLPSYNQRRSSSPVRREPPSPGEIALRVAAEALLECELLVVQDRLEESERERKKLEARVAELEGELARAKAATKTAAATRSAADAGGVWPPYADECPLRSVKSDAALDERTARRNSTSIIPIKKKSHLSFWH